MRFFRIFVQLALLLIASFSFSACAQSDHINGDRVSAAENFVTILSDAGEHTFQVEIADEMEEMRIGLMYRTQLAQDAGMLFDYGAPQQVSMWMKNTLISLDIAFIDEGGVIRRIAANTTPRSLESIPSRAVVLGVLEVNAGVFAELGIKEGDIVRHPIFNN